MDIEDREWWKVARSGDNDAARHAFDCLYRRYAAPLVQFAASQCRRQDAEEVVSSVFASIWIARATLEVHGPVRAYLYGAVRKRAYKVRAEGRRSTQFSAREAASAAIDLTVEPKELPDPGMVRLILRQVDQLPFRQRIVFLLRVVTEMSYVDIGLVLDILPSTVDTLLWRARRRLRELCAPFAGLSRSARTPEHLDEDGA
jgi:RNA polymerase sigma-70 factor (ECF subfamily)